MTDGITLGHRCCSVHDCKERLPTTKARYCLTHEDGHARKCAIVECCLPHTAKSRTCEIELHKERERIFKEKSSAIFQLKQRLQKFSIKQPQHALDPQGETQEQGDEEEVGMEVELEETELCLSKEEQASKLEIRPHFGGRRTYCEELCVGSCGMIIGRATMYGSEAANGVAVCSSLDLTCFIDLLYCSDILDTAIP